MPRAYHSASSIALGARCQHAWALQYIAKIREPEVTWAQIEAGAACTARQRSAALGVAMHAVGEDYYSARTPDWNGLPGQVFASGREHLPHPDLCEWVAVEEGIGAVALPPSEHADAPTTALDVDGVLWAGFKDLVAAPVGEEIDRLGLTLPDGLVLVDYKSSSNIARYALTPAKLANDVAASLYAIDVCERYDVNEVPLRWVYFETKSVRRSRPVDAMITQSAAYRKIIFDCNPLARLLDTYERIEDAPKNPLACGDYGGCPHHKSAGGTCDAKRPLGALVQVRVKKEKSPMAVDPKVLARFKKATGGEPEAQPEAEAPEQAEAQPAEQPAAKPARKLGVSKAVKASAPTGGLAADLAPLVAALAEAEAKVAELKDLLRQAVA